MGRGITLRSSGAGVAIGSLLAGVMWWAPGILDGSFVLVAAVGVVWAAATASLLYVFQAHPHQEAGGPWGAVIGGSLLFGVALNLSDLTMSNGAWAALTVLAVGFTTVGYAAGMGTVYRQERGA